MISILSWNIRQGGGTRTLGIIRKIAKIKPQIVILSEYRNNKHGGSIRNTLMDLGYRYQFVTHADTDVNSVIILSTLPCSSTTYHLRKMDYDANLVKASFGIFDVIGVYLPHKKKHKLFDILNEEAMTDTPLIIAGDYNTGKNGIDQKGDSFWYTDDLRKLEKEGMVDAFRHLHGNVKEYSWYSHQGNGYRYDHTYISGEVLPIVKSCYYLHEWREEGLSDHSPMMVEIG